MEPVPFFCWYTILRAFDSVKSRNRVAALVKGAILKNADS